MRRFNLAFASRAGANACYDDLEGKLAMSTPGAIEMSATWSFPTVDRIIQALPPIETSWAALPSPGSIAQLNQREKLLGSASISCRAFQLMHDIISDMNLCHLIIRHPASLKASTKQSLIGGCLKGVTLHVNKTLTVRLGTQHLLLTGTGDFAVSRQLLQQITARFAFSKRIVKTCRINPTDFAPESELGLQVGMVSPFIAPAVSRQKLRGIALLATPQIDADDQMVAISLSPFESLVVRLCDFDALAYLYARRAYPDLYWTKVLPLP